MRDVELDIETYSEEDLKRAGAYRYAAHPSTELLCVCYAFKGEDIVTLWVPHDVTEELLQMTLARLPKTDRVLIQHDVPDDLRQHIEAGGKVRAHNANFERTVLNGVAGKKVNFPHLTIEQMVCTAAKMRVHGLPGALEDAASALGTHPKDSTGKGSMLQLCKPRTGEVKRYGMEEYPEKYAHLFSYCVDDVRAERGVDDAVPDLTDKEVAIWQLDQRANDRGILLDTKFIADVQFLIEEYKAHLEALCREWTGFKPTQRDKIAEWVRANGYPQLVDMTADTVRKTVKDDACPERTKDVLRLYSTYGMKAVSKYSRMLEAMGADERIRGMFMHYGAGTGRWSSMIVQLQNLFRPVIKDTDNAITAIATRDLDWIRTLYTVDPMKVFASCVRGSLIASPGREILAIDYSGIESRLTAWVFNERWKLAAFRAQDDKTGPDSYKLAYSKLFQIPVDAVRDAQRQIGKVCIAEGTLVLCETGWKPIEEVTTSDKVWDGESWVNHKGLSYNGFKPTVNLCGSWLTPDHLVWCGQEWKRTDWLLGRTDRSLTQALEHAAACLPSQDTSAARPSEPSLRSSLNAIAGGPSSRSPRGISGRLQRLVAWFAAIRKRMQHASRSGSTLQSCRTTSIEGGSAPDSQQPSQGATFLRQSSTAPMAAEAYLSVTNGETTRARFFDTYKRCLDGIRRAFRWTESTTTGVMSPATFGSSAAPTTTETAAPSPSTSKKSHVYDLLSVGSKNRFTIWTDAGPLLVHNCELSMGFEGGVLAFVTMAATYNIDLNELTESVWPTLPPELIEEARWSWEWAQKRGATGGLPERTYLVCECLKRLWRAAHPAHRQGWKDMKSAAIMAVQNPGTAFAISTKKIIFKKVDQWLYMRLPSGRKIAYFRPEVVQPKPIETPDGKVKIPDPVLYYWGVDTESRRWMRVATYGGRQTQNFAEGIARDLLVCGLQNLEAAGYPVLGSVHDEGLFEPEEGHGSFEEAKKLFLAAPSWAEGLPLNAAGFRAKRYRK